VRKSVYDVVRLPPLVVDALITVGIAVVVILLPAFFQRLFGVYPLGSSVLYNLLLTAPLVLRRLRPVLSFALVSMVGLLQLWVIARPLWGDVAILVAVSSIARYGPTWARWGGLAVGLFGAVLGPLQWIGGLGSINRRSDVYPMLVVAFAVLSCWILGDLRRTRSIYVAELEERNRRLATERDQQAVIAAAAERQRIAREMHDVVAHSLSVIVVQADGGRYAAERDPEAAKRVLETISASSRSALAEMRRLLGLLRPGDLTEAMAPQPGVEDIQRLVDNVATSGLQVTFGVVGSSRRVDDGTGLTVYRIVQEGLTNTIKHAGPRASATVRLEYGDRDLTVVVADDGRGPRGWPGRDGTGQGLMGMRERLELHGGTLLVRARPGGGFELRATVPLVPVVEVA
jgi:signal transduction histidine kinase